MVQVHTSFILSLFYLLASNNNFCQCDCGSPAVPITLKLEKKEKDVYLENDVAIYGCKNESHKIYGKSSRKCQNRRWMGSFPQCLENMTLVPNLTITTEDRKNLIAQDDLFQLIHRNRKVESNYGISLEALNDDNNDMGLRWAADSFDERLISSNSYDFILAYLIFSTTNKRCAIKKAQIELTVSGFECTADRGRDLLPNNFMVKMKCSKSNNRNRPNNKQITVALNNPKCYDNTALNEIKIHRSHIPAETYNCGSIEKPLHSSTKKLNNTVKFKCNKGFVLIGNNLVKCLKNNTWSSESPLCVPKYTCDISDAIPERPTKVMAKFHNLINYEAKMVGVKGSFVTFTCLDRRLAIEKMFMRGDSVRFCTPMFGWSGTDPDCTYLDEWDRQEAFSENAPVKYSVINDNAVHCDVLDNHERNHSSCVPHTCPMPPDDIDSDVMITYFSMNNGNTTYDSNLVTLSCKSNKLLIGPSTRICLNNDGLWSGSAAYCTNKPALQ